MTPRLPPEPKGAMDMPLRKLKVAALIGTTAIASLRQFADGTLLLDRGCGRGKSAARSMSA